MSTKPINIVWLKRDLRTQDHQGLSRAENANIDYRIVYFFEPSIITYPDTSDRHLQFIYHSIEAINKTLAPFNRSVDVFYKRGYLLITLPGCFCATFSVAINVLDIKNAA